MSFLVILLFQERMPLFYHFIILRYNPIIITVVVVVIDISRHCLSYQLIILRYNAIFLFDNVMYRSYRRILTHEVIMSPYCLIIST